MKTPILIFCLIIFCCMTVNAQKGWIQLFNGKDLTNWIIKIKDHPLNENYGNTFRVENGVMKVSYDQYNDQFKEQFGHIFYTQKFSAYLLVVEYNTDTANRWVPYPVSFYNLKKFFETYSYVTEKLGLFPSRYQGNMYSAIIHKAG